MKKALSILLVLLSLSVQGQIIKNNGTHCRKLIIEGNSLMNLAENVNNVFNGRYVSTGIYNNVKNSFKCWVDYSISSQTQTQINAAQSTRIAPYAKPGDVLVIWEGTNDLYVNPTMTGAQAFANLVTYLQGIPAGVRVIVGTIAARDHSMDTDDMMDRINAYNALVRSSSVTYGYTICDIAADSHFDTIDKTTNTEYYLTDEIHMATAGQNIVITLFTSAIQSVL